MKQRNGVAALCLLLSLVILLTLGLTGCDRNKMSRRKKQEEPPPPPPVGEAGRALEAAFLSSISNPGAVQEELQKFRTTYQGDPKVPIILSRIAHKVTNQGLNYLRQEQWQLAANAAQLSLTADSQNRLAPIIQQRAMVELTRPQLTIKGFLTDPKGIVHATVEVWK